MWAAPVRPSDRAPARELPPGEHGVEPVGRPGRSAPLVQELTTFPDTEEGRRGRFAG
jgi:hypothetical protein